MEIDGRTKVYGIIGNPVHHSLSPLMHNNAFRHAGLNCVYLPFRTADLEGALQGIRCLDINGVSVTIPHKEAVLAFLEVIDPVARKIGSVNTIVCKRDDDAPKLLGYNTDWIGANRALAGQIEVKGTRAVILGAGGSARAIGFGLLEAGASICLCSRTESRGRRLAEELGCEWISLDESNALRGDVLVNATSVGMVPDIEKSPVPPEVTEAFEAVMDIVYAPHMTKLLKDAESRGCRLIHGLDMLLYQGAAQFELWTGLDAPVDVMRGALMEATGNIAQR